MRDVGGRRAHLGFQVLTMRALLCEAKQLQGSNHCNALVRAAGYFQHLTLDRT